MELVPCWGLFWFGISSLLQALQRSCFPYVEIPTLPGRHSARKRGQRLLGEDISVLHKALLSKNTPVFLLLNTGFQAGDVSKNCPGGFHFNPFQMHLKACCQEPEKEGRILRGVSKMKKGSVRRRLHFVEHTGRVTRCTYCFT